MDDQSAAAEAKEVIAMLKARGGIRTGHFVFTSGGHSDTYFNKDELFPFLSEMSQLGFYLAKRFLEDKIEMVVAPAIGAIQLAVWIAYHLNESNWRCDSEILVVYGEKTSGRQKIRRGFGRHLHGKRCVVVDDILTTGSSLIEMIGSVRNLGGEVVAAAAVFSRGSLTAEMLGVSRLEVIADVGNLSGRTWLSATECELCASHVPINQEFGHGRDYKTKADSE